MDAIEAILTRRSIRKFRKEPVTEEMLHAILQAAMFAPSARNQQPWHFVVVTSESLKRELMNAHPYASMLGEAPLAILVCGDTTLEKSPGYWPIDCSAATQNLLLAAHAVGLGAVWLGVHPRQERKDAIRRIFRLPANIEPFALVAVGHPDEQKEAPGRFRPERIRFNSWSEPPEPSEPAKIK